MNNYKSRTYFLFFLIGGLSLSSITMHSFNIDEIDFPTEQTDEFDSFFDESGEMNVKKSMMRSCEAGEATIWVTYLEALGIPDLLDAPFYLNTNIPTVRNLINYPNFFLFQPLAKQELRFYTFYNAASKKNFTKARTNKITENKCDYQSGQRLGSYLNVEDAGILSFLETDIPKYRELLPPALQPLTHIHFPLILNALGNARLEERRLGVMFHYYKEFNQKTILEIRMPILYQIHNLNFNEEDKNTLDTQFSEFEQDPNFDEIEFGKKHFAMDAIGSGTMDVTLEHVCYESSDAKVTIGGALYLPTDARWISGIVGSYFKPKDIQPVLRLCELVNISGATPSLNPHAQEMIQDYFLAALDHLSSAILQCPMGYNNHLGIALKVLPYWQWKENLLYSGMYIFEYLIPREEDRFYITKEKVPFSTQFAETQGDEAKLALLEQQITAHLFPRVFTTNVSPGFIVNTISNLQWTRHAWDYTIGYNWWYKTGEKLSSIQSLGIDPADLDIRRATAKSASQVKLYANLHTIFKTENHDISCSIFGNLTVYNENVGNDFMFGIAFDKTF